MIDTLLETCPRCGRQWFHIFQDGNPTCTPCVRKDAAQRPQNARTAKKGSK